MPTQADSRGSPERRAGGGDRDPYSIEPAPATSMNPFNHEHDGPAIRAGERAPKRLIIGTVAIIPQPQVTTESLADAHAPRRPRATAASISDVPIRVLTCAGGLLSASKWLVRPLPRQRPQSRLICLPYAGGSAATYIPWAAHLPANVELVCVQPPGRASRMAERAHSQMSSLVAELMTLFHEVADRPYVLFGHSLGGLVAYELAQQCRRAGLPLPELLIASASRSPQFANHSNRIYDLPDAEFVAKLRELDGTPAEVLDNDELVAFLTPLLRADFKIADTYLATPSRLDCPIVVLSGEEDWEVTDQALQGWRELAHGRCEFHRLPGGHFFIEQHRDLVLEKVRLAIAEASRLDRVG